MPAVPIVVVVMPLFGRVVPCSEPLRTSRFHETNCTQDQSRGEKGAAISP
jgi:hypothetical protein